MSQLEIKIPDIGDFSEVDVIEVLVAEGDSVKAEQSLITVESDKASRESQWPASGSCKALKVKVGVKVREGSVILELEEAAGAPAATVEQSEDAAEQGKTESASGPATPDSTPKAEAATSEGKKAAA